MLKNENTTSTQATTNNLQLSNKEAVHQCLIITFRLESLSRNTQNYAR